MTVCGATHVQICNEWKMKDGRRPQDTHGLREREGERQLSPALLQTNTGKSHFRLLSRSEWRCPRWISVHADAAVYPGAAVFKCINRCFFFIWVRLHQYLSITSPLNMNVYYPRGQKRAWPQICCRGLCSAEDSSPRQAWSFWFFIQHKH